MILAMAAVDVAAAAATVDVTADAKRPTGSSFEVLHLHCFSPSCTQLKRFALGMWSTLAAHPATDWTDTLCVVLQALFLKPSREQVCHD